LYDVANQKYFKLFDGSTVSDEALAVFGPSGATSGLLRIAAVKAGSVYLKTYNPTSQQLSEETVFSNSDPAVFAGIADWLLEEEVLSSQVALYFSPSGDKFAFFVMNDTRVPVFEYPLYNKDSAYTDIQNLRYPTAGQTNPLISLFMYDTATVGVSNLIYQGAVDELLFGVSWLSESQILLRSMNRIQNESTIIRMNSDGSTQASIFEEVQQGGWVMPKGAPIAVDASRFLDVLVDSTGYFHVALVDATTGSTTFLTSGEFVVQGISCYNSKTQSVVYYSSGSGNPISEQHYYSVPINGPYTSSLLFDNNARYAVAQFDAQCSNYLLSAQSPDVLPHWFFVSDQGKTQTVIESNDAYQGILNTMNLPSQVFMQATDAKFNGYLLLPPNFDPKRKYAVLMHPYGGPNSQMAVATHRMHDTFETYLVSNFDVIVAVFDGYGTCCRSTDFLFKIYKQLGTAEFQSQVDTARWLAQTLPYVDSSRMALMGWSFGGLQGANCITYDPKTNPFACCISIAPVTDWLYYDSAYTERYMQTPGMNPDGYQSTSVLGRAGNVNRPYLLMHGTGDDNVHYLNSMNWVDALLQANVVYPPGQDSLGGETLVDTFFFPNRQHSIGDPAARRGVWSKVSTFLQKNLKLTRTSE
jgi:dipeptidyl aminopeptidase/acylaminoacyl peptidase